jgi:hypothetical protein
MKAKQVMAAKSDRGDVYVGVMSNPDKGASLLHVCIYSSDDKSFVIKQRVLLPAKARDTAIAVFREKLYCAYIVDLASSAKPEVEMKGVDGTVERKGSKEFSRIGVITDDFSETMSSE